MCYKYAKYCEIYCVKTMETYCASFKKNTANKNASVRRTKQNGLMLLSYCDACGKKRSRFIKK